MGRQSRSPGVPKGRYMGYSIIYQIYIVLLKNQNNKVVLQAVFVIFGLIDLISMN